MQLKNWFWTGSNNLFSHDKLVPKLSYIQEQIALGKNIMQIGNKDWKESKLFVLRLMNSRIETYILYSECVVWKKMMRKWDIKEAKLIYLENSRSATKVNLSFGN